MKKIKNFAACCIAVMIMLAAAVTYADDGKEINKFYNFNDYTAEVGSDNMPDENWDYLVGRYNQFGSAFADDEHKRVLKSTNGSEPNFYFGQSINTGNLHISFDSKVLSDSQRIYTIFYHQRKWGTATLPRRTEAGTSGYSLLHMINGRVNEFAWFQKPGKDTTSMLGWDYLKSDKKVDFTQWHRFDMITSGLSGDDCYVNIYLDGEKMNETPIYFGASQGFHTIGFRHEIGEGSNPQGSYLDNVRIHRFTGEESLEMNIMSDERVALNDGTIKVHLSDFVDRADLNNNNIKINKVGGGAISNYTIKPDSSGGAFDINFNGAIEPDRYEISLANVKGKLTGAEPSGTLKFKTDFKRVEVDGSVYENDFDDYVSDDGTLPNGFSTSGDAKYAKSIDDQNGGKAFGIESGENSRNVQRYMTEFNSEILSDADGDIDFDFTLPSVDGDIRFYLSTPSDSGNSVQNSFLKVDNLGGVYIADSATANPTKKAEGITLESGKWHHVYAKVRTDSAGGAKIELVFDNDETKAITYTSPYFSNKSINGMGIGFVPKAGYSAAVDNISVSTKMNLACPEVVNIKLFDNLGRELKTEEKITAMTSRAEIKFNTLVTEDADELKKYIILNENTWTRDYDVSVVTNEDKTSTVICTFPQMLEEMSNYKLEVNTGIQSKLSSEVRSVLVDELSFVTDRTRALTINGLDDDGNPTSEITFLKNDSSSADLLYGAAQYEYKNCMVDGARIEVPIMKDFKFKRIVIGADFVGSVTENINLPINGGGSEDENTPKVENKYFLWKYPTFERVLVNSENVLQ